MKITQPTNKDFLVVKDGRFFIESFCSGEGHNFFPLFELEEYEQEKQLAKKLSYPKSGRFPLRHFTDAERTNALATKYSGFDDQLSIQWMDNVLLLDPHDFNSVSRYGAIYKSIIILEGCFLHNAH